jgi:hypothetical protein
MFLGSSTTSAEAVAFFLFSGQIIVLNNLINYNYRPVIELN